MSNIFDPYTGHQLRTLRSDPTGRWSPISEPGMQGPWWLGYLVGIVMACILALMMWWAI